jgi:membrane fusion protein (multidrug efflux system)
MLATADARDPGDDVVSGSRGRRVRRAVLLWCVPALVAVVAVFVYGRGGTVATTDNAYVKQDRVDVAPLVSGEVREVRVVENAPVAAGDVILVLDDRTLRVREQRATAQLSSARLAVESIRAEYRARAEEVGLARDTAQYAVREFGRQRELADRNLVTQTALDEAHRAAVAATGAIGLLELQLAETEARLGGDPALPVDQHPAVQSAAAELAQAEVDLAYATVRAPRAGIVSRLPHVGDYVASGKAAFAIVTDAQVWVEANFKETDLGWVRPGQPAHVEVDLYPGLAWTGRVESVAQATGAEFSLLPAQNASGNWVKVVQRIPVRIAIVARPGDPPLRIGASARIEIETDAPTRMQRWLARLRS